MQSLTITTVFLIVTALATSAALPAMIFAASGSGPPELTIGIRIHRNAVFITATRGLSVRDTHSGRRLFSKLKPTPVRFSVDPKGFRIHGFGVRSNVRISPLKGGHLSVDGAPYRGDLIVEEDRFGKITVINVVDVESYLYGVIKSEMLISSPMEALKAQAVIARTYAIKHKDRYVKDRGFGLTADTTSQVYSGMRGEDPRATRAVNATRGIVITVGGRLIQAYYHSACGGWTINNEDAWGGAPLPYLRAVRCGYCADSAGFCWKVKLSYSTILEKLLEAGHRLSHITSIHPIRDPESGRTLVVIIENDSNQIRLLGNQFRLIIGPSVIKSSFYTIRSPGEDEKLPERVTGEARQRELKMRSLIGDYLKTVRPPQELVVEGCGSGHGVGLCQSGARGLAELGSKFHDILTFYYHGVKISKLY